MPLPVLVHPFPTRIREARRLTVGVGVGIDGLGGHRGTATSQDSSHTTKSRQLLNFFVEVPNLFWS